MYIGKTKRSYAQRFNEHETDWLWNIRGQIRVRIGMLEFPNGGKYSEKKLADTEALLISYHRPEENIKSIEYYRGREGLKVINLGNRGLIKDCISTDDYEWA
jgi:hypothetical protein